MDLVIERGYEAFSVEDIRARAGVSQAEFDARFTSLHDCLDGTYEANIAEFDQALVGPYLEAPSWREGLRAGAYGAAAHLRGHRRERRYGELRNGRGGPMELAARDRYLQRVVDLIGAGRFETGDPEAFGRATAEAALGSVYELLLKRLRETGGEDPGLAIVPEASCTSSSAPISVTRPHSRSWRSRRPTQRKTKPHTRVKASAARQLIPLCWRSWRSSRVEARTRRDDSRGCPLDATGFRASSSARTSATGSPPGSSPPSPSAATATPRSATSPPPPASRAAPSTPTSAPRTSASSPPST